LITKDGAAASLGRQAWFASGPPRPGEKISPVALAFHVTASRGKSQRPAGSGRRRSGAASRSWQEGPLLFHYDAPWLILPLKWWTLEKFPGPRGWRAAPRGAGRGSGAKCLSLKIQGLPWL